MMTTSPFKMQKISILLMSLIFIQSHIWGQDRPNIVLIIVDDMRYDEFGGGGHSFLQTPSIDKLAESGVVFERAYHAVPLCSPNRASILTGQYPSRHGILDNTSRSHASHLLDLFPRYLQEGGYQTAHVGKWHMGNDPSPRPGYDYWASFSGQGKTYDPELRIQDSTVHVKGYITDIFTDLALGFIKESVASKVPFFVCLAHKAIHPEAVQRDDGSVDMNVPKEFIPAKRHAGVYETEVAQRHPNVPSVSKAQDSKPVLREAFDLRAKAMMADPAWNQFLDLGVSDHTIRRRAEMMLAVDESVAKLTRTMEELDILENTLIIFTSDNGYFYGEHGLSLERRMPYEESIRSPLIFHYPGFPESKKPDKSLVLSIDLAPTILEFAGLPISKSIQGKSLMPLINGKADHIRRTAYIEFYSHENPFPWTANLDYRIVMTDRHKYIRWIRKDDREELYDLSIDPFELNNLIDDPLKENMISIMREQLKTLSLQAMGYDW